MFAWGGYVHVGSRHDISPFYDYNNFNTYLSGLMTIFQVLVINDWNHIMKVFTATGFGHFVYPFFVICNIINFSILLNILTAFFIGGKFGSERFLFCVIFHPFSHDICEVLLVCREQKHLSGNQHWGKEMVILMKDQAYKTSPSIMRMNLPVHQAMIIYLATMKKLTKKCKHTKGAFAMKSFQTNRCWQYHVNYCRWREVRRWSS